MTKASANALSLMRVSPGIKPPNHPGNEAPRNEAPTIDRIGNAVVKYPWAKPLEKNNPHRDMECYLPPARRFVIGAKTDPAVKEKEDRKCHGHGQGVVKMPVKKR